MIDFSKLPRTNVIIKTGDCQGPLEVWRQSLGQGGTNSQPLPPAVVNAVRKLQPRLIRIFIQEFFDIYPDHDTYNWSKLDPYMDALAQTGATVMASINIKPRILFPTIDQNIWQPNNVPEYQQLISKLVRRYSIEKTIVTHWEHINEADIGENGGCPFHIPSPEESHTAYQMIIKPVLETFPGAKVGGPCTADPKAVIPFINLCAQNGTPLDFISYHLYHNDASVHQDTVMMIDQAARTAYPGKRPEILINEWNKGFDVSGDGTGYDFVSVEEMAYHPRRAAQAAKILLKFLQSPLDWSFYYHIWDKGISTHEFDGFFSPEGVKEVMYRHWNEAPHRFGLFSENGRVRPQYFVYQMLQKMTGIHVDSASQNPDLAVIASRKDNECRVMLVNHNSQGSQDHIARLNFTGLPRGLKQLRAFRIDDTRHWDTPSLELIPVEERIVDTLPSFSVQFYCPADSVLLIELIPV